MSAHLVEVVITGHLGPSLIAALEGYDVVRRDDGTSSVTGMVSDQAELRALLAVFDGLNIEVVSVNRVTSA
ncbi:hypothetical protein [Microbacterium flavescens]|uniref:hypothetical protein n=1 Tax=Microbacterium flavescens TaxID=69366 RepID=UPI001BDF6FAF|nr:hypothetical protein [Microbacterium flavescens]BFF09763.1 hypothetical protein GCM10025699_10660 [Microbacterium flavescens]